MRMWLGVDPRDMCRQHLLGEHVEMHMAAGTVRKGKRWGKLAQFVDPAQIQARHDRLAAEMERRGMNHKSPLEQPDVSDYPTVFIEPGASRAELARRCPECDLEA